MSAEKKMHNIKITPKDFMLKIKAENKGQSPHFTAQNFAKALRLRSTIKHLTKDFGHATTTVEPLKELLKSFRTNVVQHPPILNVALIRKKDGISIESSFDKFPSLMELKELKSDLLVKIQDARKARKEVSITNKKFMDVDISTVGMVRTKDGAFLKLLPKLEEKRIKQPKAPKNDDQHIGIELEFGSPSSQEELNNDFIKAKLSRFLHLGTDGSLSGFPSGYRGHELRILVKESELETVVDTTCEILRKHNAVVNKSCGLHVHIDMRKRERDLVYYNLVTQQDWLYALVPANRSESQYCQKAMSPILNDAKEAHYEGINAKAAYKEHKTFELRIHGGTTNATKIKNWIKVILSIVNQKEKISLKSPVLDLFCDTFGIDSNLKDWMQLRINKFKTAESNGQSEEHA